MIASCHAAVLSDIWSHLSMQPCLVIYDHILPCSRAQWYMITSCHAAVWRSKGTVCSWCIVTLIIIIMLAYLYCAAYTRMTMNESSLPCEQRRITFKDDGQRMQLARLELPAPHYICMYRLLPTTLPSPSRHYYPRLIAGTNLPTPKGWIA